MGSACTPFTSDTTSVNGGTEESDVDGSGYMMARFGSYPASTKVVFASTVGEVGLEYVYKEPDTELYVNIAFWSVDVLYGYPVGPANPVAPV